MTRPDSRDGLLTKPLAAPVTTPVVAPESVPVAAPEIPPATAPDRSAVTAADGQARYINESRETDTSREVGNRENAQQHDAVRSSRARATATIAKA